MLDFVLLARLVIRYRCQDGLQTLDVLSINCSIKELGVKFSRAINMGMQISQQQLEHVHLISIDSLGDGVHSSSEARR